MGQWFLFLVSFAHCIALSQLLRRFSVRCWWNYFSLSLSISLLHLFFFPGIYVLQHCRLSTFGSVVLLSDRPLVQLSSVNVCKSLWAVGCVVNHWWRRWKQKWKQDSKWKDNFIQSYYLSHFAFWAQCAASCISRCFYGFELTNKLIYEAQVQQYNAY